MNFNERKKSIGIQNQKDAIKAIEVTLFNNKPSNVEGIKLISLKTIEDGKLVDYSDKEYLDQNQVGYIDIALNDYKERVKMTLSDNGREWKVMRPDVLVLSYVKSWKQEERDNNRIVIVTAFKKSKKGYALSIWESVDIPPQFLQATLESLFKLSNFTGIEMSNVPIGEKEVKSYE